MKGSPHQQAHKTVKKVWQLDSQGESSRAEQNTAHKGLRMVGEKKGLSGLQNIICGMQRTNKGGEIEKEKQVSTSWRGRVKTIQQIDIKKSPKNKNKNIQKVQLATWACCTSCHTSPAVLAPLACRLFLAICNASKLGQIIKSKKRKSHKHTGV